jgi:hypothetical protein
MNSVDPNHAATTPNLTGGPTTHGLADWWDSMLWHRVLRASVLGLRPGRLGLAFFFTVGVLLLLVVGRAIDAQLIPDPPPMPRAAPGDNDPFVIWRLFVQMPISWVRGWPVTTLIMGPLSLILGSIMLGAISRIAAEEFARGRFVPWHEGLAFSARLWRSTLGAYLGPIVLIWLVALKLAIVGWLLLNWPGLNVIGSVFYGLFLLGAFIAVVVGIAFILGGALLAPAVVCEGADAIDAIQRSYAYVLARPLRLVIYLLLGLAGVFVVVSILWLIATLTIGFSLRAAGAFLRPPSWSTLWWGSFRAPPPLAVASEPPQGSYAVAMAFIQIWVLVPALLVLGAFFSMLTAAATVVYLAMRRVCDGQDLGELWTPGAIETAMAAVLASRARAAGPVVANPQIEDLDKPEPL